jgi:hypothetical protein
MLQQVAAEWCKPNQTLKKKKKKKKTVFDDLN